MSSVGPGPWSAALPNCRLLPSTARSRRPARRRGCASWRCLAEAELTVSDLTDILRQSQPRISRHLQAAGRGRPGRALPRGLVGVLPARRAQRQRGAGARSDRAARSRPTRPSRATASGSPRCARRAPRRRRPISARHAAEWDRIRKLHVADDAVEAAIRAALADRPFRSLLDLGTGTGRMLELFGPRDRARPRPRPVARHAGAGARAARPRRACAIAACGRATSTICALPTDSFDVVIIHQVLHFLDDGARAIARGGARAAPGRAAAGRRFRAARSRIPARRARPSPARLSRPRR